MKITKKMLCFIVTTVMLVGFIAGATASSGIIKITADINTNINYILNGNIFVPKDADGSRMDTIIYNGRSYVPLRAIANALDVPVNWNDKTSTIILGENNVSEEIKNEYSEEITLLHFNQDEADLLARDFMASHPGVKVNTDCISDTNMDYQNYLASILSSGSIDADVIALDVSFVKKYINITDGFENLSSSPYNAEKLYDKLVPYTIDVGKSNDGKIRALSHHANPLGIGYKRDIAKTYLGTDNPVEISKMFASSEKILETARKLKEKSGGKIKLFPNLAELLRLYLGNRDTGWIKDGKLFIDPEIDKFLDLAKKLYTEGLVGNLDQWTPQWAHAVNDNEHFAWAIASWGVPWVLSVNMDEQYKDKGKWAIAIPETTGFWGGTWFGINSSSTKKDLSWEFINYITTNAEQSEKWAAETGDFVSNLESINKLADNNNFISPTINQNLYNLYKPVLGKINGKTMTEFDDIITNVLIYDVLYSYVTGETNKDTAIKEFRDGVYRDINID